MEFIPIKTRIMQPPKDDLFAVLDESLTDVRERDVVVVSSKVVAIGEGRCVSIGSVDRQALAAEYADMIIPRDYWGSPLIVYRNAFNASAGIDKSNGDGHFVLPLEDPFQSAMQIHTYIRTRFGIDSVGVVISDSHGQPFRYGVTGFAVGFWGFKPLESHVGKKDLFGNELRAERSNIPDGIAAGAGLVMGESAEQIPVVVVREVPGLKFVEGNLEEDLFCPFEEDTFRVLYEKFLT